VGRHGTVSMRKPQDEVVWAPGHSLDASRTRSRGISFQGVRHFRRVSGCIGR